ncbi:MAG TPA: CBS domain-containing protein [Candidatus Acidoferrales bacterium]|nr:CBS domain-containing protein [Candidatus Acidoferrales bacterium]
MNVRDVLGSRQDVYSVRDDASVHDVALYLRDKQVRAVGVVDANGRVLGVVSQADMSDKVAAENKCPAWMKVSEIMTRNPISVPMDTSLDECVRLMEKHGIFHLMVQDERAGFRGLLSVQDLLRIIVRDHKERADLFEAMMFPQH